MKEMTLKVKLNDNLKFECSGDADFVAREREQFFRAANLPVMEEPAEPVHTSAPVSQTSVLVRATEKTGELADLIKGIQSGDIPVNVGDSLSVFLKDGTLVNFVITQIDGEYIRFESEDCIGGKYVTRDKVDDLFKDFWEQLPDELKNAIVQTPRKWLDRDGVENMDYFNLFLPSAPEVFPDDECYGDNGLYEQMEWYKDRRHRLRRLSPDGDTVHWWLISAYAGNASSFADVNYNGNASDYFASATWIGAPVCFRIRKSK